jgi:hypothetical protein
MKLSIHPDIKGKPVHTERGYFSGDKQVNLGYGWMNIDVTWDDAFELITTDGLATSAELINDNRKDENYVSRQLIMVDIDDGMTIQELLNNEFYNEYGSGFYTTARHTDENHRFRIMFVTEEPITDKELMKKLIKSLLVVFRSADISCKDASRLYYGIPNCKIKENQGKILTKDMMIELTNMVDTMEKEEAKKYVNTFELTTVDEVFVDELLSRISSKVGNLRGDYNSWLTIAWATCHSVGVSTATNLLMKHWYEKTKKEKHALKTWRSSDSPTIGTLIKLSGISGEERKLLEIQAKLRKMK